MIIAIIIIVLIGLFLIVGYNRLVGLRNRINEAYANIEVYLLNRFDALTKQAEVVVSYAEHEKETLMQVTRLRASLTDQQTPDEKSEIYSSLESQLRHIQVVGESYPDLKANQNYLQLQRTITDIEEKLSASRRTFNANVTSYNTLIASIPTNLYAGLFGFTPRSLLEIEEHKKADINMKNLLRGS